MNGVLIVGAGLAAQRCAETLRAGGYDAAVRIVGDEPYAPYDRPPLSKALLRPDARHAEVALRPPDWHARHEVELVLGRRAVALDPTARVVTLAGGERIAADHVVIATGARARTLPAFERFPNAHVLRTLDDARGLGAALEPDGRLVVVGGGFLGLEVAGSARAAGVHVTIVEAARAPLSAALGTRVGHWIAALHRRHGVDVRVGARIAAAHGNGRLDEVVLADGRRLACDAALVAVGCAPAAQWIDGSPDGLAVDGEGQTRWRGIWAAGDVARPWDPATGAPARAEHWEAAARQGVAVAHGILGLPVGASPAPTFWSDQHGIRLQLAGTAVGHDALAVDGDPIAGDACVLYLRRGRPVGGLLLGRPRALPHLRRIIGGADATEVAA